MSPHNKRMSVPGVTKCHRAQIFLVISVTIALVTSCWTRAYPSLAPAVPHSQQRAAIFPGLITPLLQGRPGFWLPLRNCLYSPSFRVEAFPETRPPQARKLFGFRGCTGHRYLLFLFFKRSAGKAVGDREVSKGGSRPCNLKTYPPSTIGSGAYTT